MKKQIVKIGTSQGIRITKTECPGIAVGDWVEFEIKKIQGKPSPIEMHIEKSIEAWKKQYITIMQNAVFKLIGCRGHRDLVTVDTVKK